jgi:hypothetical protein
MAKRIPRDEVTNLIASMSAQDKHRILADVLFEFFGVIDAGNEYIDPDSGHNRVDFFALADDLRRSFWPDDRRTQAMAMNETTTISDRPSATRRLAIGLFTLSEYKHEVKFTCDKERRVYRVDVRSRAVSFNDGRVLSALGWSYITSDVAWTFMLEMPKEDHVPD